MTHSVESIKKSLRAYMLIGIILFIGTAVTVLVATRPELDIGLRGFDTWDCVLGISIAMFKSSLVAIIFMHLNHEKKAVYWIIASGVCMVLSLFLLSALALGDPIVDPFFYSNH